jgi:hypothetical protein
METSQQDIVIQTAQTYWNFRNHGDVTQETEDEARSQAHNALMDALQQAQIPFTDREDAAQIGLRFLTQHLESLSVPPKSKSKVTITFSCTPQFKADLQRLSERYNGMTAVLVHLGNKWIDREKESARKLREQAKPIRFMPKDFKTCYQQGKVTAGQLDEFIERWHTSEAAIPLHEYLGFTLQEYARFLEDIGK